SVLCEGDVLTPDEFPQIRAQVEGTINLDRPSRNIPADVANPPTGETPRAAEAAADVARPRFGTLRALDERGNVRSLAAVELDMIKLAIEHYSGQMSEVARRLGIGRSTLYRKLKEYGVDSEEGRVERMAWTP